MAKFIQLHSASNDNHESWFVNVDYIVAFFRNKKTGEDILEINFGGSGTHTYRVMETPKMIKELIDNA